VPSQPYASTLLKQRLYLLTACVVATNTLLGYLLLIGDLKAARIVFAIQTFFLVAMPWSTYKEVRRAYQGEPPNEHADVLIPWRIVLCLWVLGAFGLGVFVKL